MDNGACEDLVGAFDDFDDSAGVGGGAGCGGSTIAEDAGADGVAGECPASVLSGDEEVGVHPVIVGGDEAESTGVE